MHYGHQWRHDRCRFQSTNNFVPGPAITNILASMVRRERALSHMQPSRCELTVVIEDLSRTSKNNLHLHDHRLKVASSHKFHWWEVSLIDQGGNRTVCMHNMQHHYTGNLVAAQQGFNQRNFDHASHSLARVVDNQNLHVSSSNSKCVCKFLTVAPPWWSIPPSRFTGNPQYVSRIDCSTVSIQYTMSLVELIFLLYVLYSCVEGRRSGKKTKVYVLE
jgi:hypothetical protein